MSDIAYDPACVDCRRDAGKAPAGTTWQCWGHVRRERDELRAEVEYLQSEIQLMAAPHESVGHIIRDYRKQRDELRALLREFGDPVIRAAIPIRLLARLYAALGGER